VIEEFSRQLEFFGKLRRQCFHAEGFRCVAAGVKNIQPQFLRQRISPVRAFAGEKMFTPSAVASFKEIAFLTLRGLTATFVSTSSYLDAKPLMALRAPG
jgi:hypothetical protein